MNIITSQPATAAPVTGGTPVEGFSPEMDGYSENLASQPNNDAELPSGEKAARFEREVVPLHEVLYQHALHMCDNRADAEDLVQDTMVKAYSSFHSLAPDANVKAWLYRIQTNTYIDGYRRKLRQPLQCSTNRITEQERAAHARRTATGPVSAEDEALAALPDTEIMAAMQSLPDQLRAAVYYADVEGFRYQEIADIMAPKRKRTSSSELAYPTPSALKPTVIGWRDLIYRSRIWFLNRQASGSDRPGCAIRCTADAEAR